MCNVAITRYATARVAQASAPKQTSAGADATAATGIVRAALARHGSPELVATIASDFPLGAGLGGSSAAGVALVAALRSFSGGEITSAKARDEIAELSRALEVEEMGIAGGRQDHYAASHGGALGIEFKEHTVATPIELSDLTIASLEQQCILGYTGVSRISGLTITAVLESYSRGDATVLGALDSMKSLSLAMRDALANGDIEELGALVGEHWVHQRALHPAITTAKIDAIERAVSANGAIGMKALGASGGGCVMVIAPEGEEQRVRDAMMPFAQILPWRVATDGVLVGDETGAMEKLSLDS